MARSATSRASQAASESAQEDVSSFTTHDFSQLNRHVDDIFGRAHTVTWQRRMDVYKRFGIYTGGILLASGIFAFLLGAAYWLAFAPPKPETKILEIEKPLIVEKEKVVTIERPGPSSEISSTIARLEQAIAAGAPKGGASGSEKIVRNYTVFTNVTHQMDGISEVVSGAQFESSSTDYPSYQYCYVDLPLTGIDSGAVASQSFRLAIKNGRQTVVDIPITAELARKTGTTLSALRSARQKCKFL